MNDDLARVIGKALQQYAADPDNKTPNPSSVWIDPAARIAADVAIDTLRSEGWMDAEQVSYELIEAQERMED